MTPTSFKASTARMSALKAMLLDEFVPYLSGRRIHYVDLPVHRNIGDLLIMMGTEKVFRAAGAAVKTRASVRNPDVLWRKKIARDDLIVCHGGGNFGDIYEAHQALRLAAARTYPENPLIIMPQSVHFSDAGKLTETVDALKKHKRLTLYVRDQNSYDALRPGLGEAVKLMPDMAHMLFGKFGTDRPAGKTLTLRRRDVETTGQAGAGFDWDNLLTPRDDLIYHLFLRFYRLEERLGWDIGAASLWRQYADRLARRAEIAFAPYETVDTDRLHGAIFAQLLGRDVILRENSYGKLHRYFSQWFPSDVAEVVPRLSA